MHNELGTWVTLPRHIHLGGALKMIIMKYMHSSLMTHKYRGSIVVLSISKSVKSNEEQKEMTIGFSKVFSASTEIISNEYFDSKIICNEQVMVTTNNMQQGSPILLWQRTGQNGLL